MPVTRHPLRRFQHAQKEKKIRKRCKAYYGEDFEVSYEQIFENSAAKLKLPGKKFRGCC